MRYELFCVFAPIVGVQLVFASGATVTLGILLAKRKLQKRKLERRLLVYLYELPLIALYSHFLWTGPSVPAPTASSLVYWAAQICFAELALAPLIIDRRYFVEELRFGPRHRKKIGPLGRLMWMGLRSLPLFLVLVVLVCYFALMVRSLALVQQ